MFYNSADKRLYVGNSADLPTLVADNPDDISAKILAVEATANSANHTYVQALAPSSPDTGDFWFDTLTVNLLVFDGTDWQYAVNLAASNVTGVYPVTSDAFFDHIVYTTSDQGEIDLALRLISSATDWVEQYTGRYFVVRNITHNLDTFPANQLGKKQPITLVGGEANSVATVSYYDSSYASQSLDSSNYRLINKHGKTHVYPAMGTQWPTNVASNEPDVVAVTYEIGTLPADVPASVRSAIMLIAASLWEHRENEIVGTNIKSLKPVIAAKDLLHPFKLR